MIDSHNVAILLNIQIDLCLHWFWSLAFTCAEVFLQLCCGHTHTTACITFSFAHLPHSIDRLCWATVTGKAVIALTFDPDQTFELCGEWQTEPTVGHKQTQSQTFTISVMPDRCVICLAEWPWGLRGLALGASMLKLLAIQVLKLHDQLDSLVWFVQQQFKSFKSEVL